MFRHIGKGDREHNRRLGRASYDIIFASIGEWSADATVVIDAWLGFQPADVLDRHLSTVGIARTAKLGCHAPGPVLAERYCRERRRAPRVIPDRSTSRNSWRSTRGRRPSALARAFTSIRRHPSTRTPSWPGSRRRSRRPDLHLAFPWSGPRSDRGPGHPAASPRSRPSRPSNPARKAGRGQVRRFARRLALAACLGEGSALIPPFLAGAVASRLDEHRSRNVGDLDGQPHRRTASCGTFDVDRGQ